MNGLLQFLGSVSIMIAPLLAGSRHLLGVFSLAPGGRSWKSAPKAFVFLINPNST